MNILYLASAAIPSESANSLQIIKMVEALKYSGHDTGLFVPRRKNRNQYDATQLREQYGLRSDIEIKYIPWLPTAFGTLLFVLISVIIFSLRHGRADLVITREPNLAFCTSLLRLNTAIEIHQLPVTRIAKWTLTRLVRSSTKSKRVTLIGITNGIKTDVLKTTGNQNRSPQMYVLPSGVDLSHFESMQANFTVTNINRTGLKPVLVYAGSFFRGKGVDEILQIAELMAEAEFILIGGHGKHLERIKSQISTKQLANVLTPGHVSHQMIPSWLKLADILLLPMQENVEASGGQNIGRWTSPIKLFEYMAADRPICVSDLPILREIVQEHQVKFVTASNPKAWVLAIRELMNDPQAMKTLSDESKSAAQQYGWNGRAEKLVRWSTTNQKPSL